MARKSLTKKWLKTAEGKIFYFSGPHFPGQPTLVFMHGLSANHTTWAGIMRYFGHNKYNTLALDLRGHGLSDKSKKKFLYKIPVFSNDLALILEKEKISEFILVGYSFGGTIAIDYAINNFRSPSRVILISANHASPLENRNMKFLAMPIYWLINFLASLFYWQKEKGLYDYYRPGETKGYWASVLKGLKTMPISINFWMLSQMLIVNFKARISLIKSPVLIIYSRRDPFLSGSMAVSMAKLLPQAEIVVSKSDSHFIATHAQEEVSEIIFKFLKRYENSDL